MLLQVICCLVQCSALTTKTLWQLNEKVTHPYCITFGLVYLLNSLKEYFLEPIFFRTHCILGPSLF